MADFLSKIKISFIDDFSRGAAAARSQLEGLGAAGVGFNTAGRKMMRAGAGLTAGVSAPLAAVGVAAYKAGENLNRGMANVQSLGLTQSRVAELKRGLQDAAISVRASTTDMSDGLYQVISAMGDSSETVQILKINATAAAAGLATTTDAINLSSAVMKGYGDVSAASNQRIADLALQTVKLGQTTFPELAASIGKVTPLAAQMNVSQEELFATMATFTGVTGGAAEVTTQMRGAIQSLMSPSSAMSGLLSQLGFESGEAMIQQMGFQGAMLEVVDAAHKSGQPLQSFMGSIEGQTLALAMAGGQADVYPEKLAAMANAAGAADAAFKAQTEGINANGSALALARVKLEVMLQRLSDGLAPAITAGMDVIGPFVDKIGALATRFAELEPAQQKNIVKILGIVAAAGPALMIFGGMSRGVSSIIGMVSKAIPLFVGLQGVLFGTTTAAGVATPGLFGLAAANWAVVAPILAVVAVIGVLIGAFILIKRHADSIRTFFLNLWQGIKDTFNAAVDWVVDLLDNKLVQGALVVLAPFIGIPLAIIKNWDAIKIFFANLWQGIKDIFGSGISWIKDKVTDIPIIGKLFGGGKNDSSPATVDTLSAGMTAALPVAERAGFEVASAIDQYMPHSDAKKGPLSRLTESGGALIDTLRQGALKKRLDLSGALGFSAGRGESDGGSGTTIHIENLTVQSEDADDIFRFVRMLKVAGGAA